jgi:tetratricopeptide (TPR) repeat protein
MIRRRSLRLAPVVIGQLVLLWAFAVPSSSLAQDAAEEQNAAYSRSLAESRYLDGDLESAVHLYLQASRLSTNAGERTSALVNAAWLEFLLGDEEQCSAILRAALRTDPGLALDERLYTDDFMSVFLRARLAAVREGLGGSNAVQDVSLARAAPSDGPRVIYAQALQRLEAKDLEGALGDFQRVAALTLDGQGEELELRRKSLVRIGWIYLQRDQWGDAARSYDDALGIDRSDAETWKSLGLARLRGQELSGAIAAFREAYALDPADLSTAHSLARSLVQAERWEDAVSWISDAVRHHERDAELQLQLGRAYAGRGSRRQAEAAWKLAMALDDSSDWALGHSAAMRLALALFDNGSHPESARVSQAAIERRPGDARFWNLLGLAQQEAGEVEPAVGSFQRACEHDPDRAEYRNNLGRALAATGDLAEAERAFVVALTLEPDSATAQANLSQVRARLRER